jgi:hypothetical protein
LEKSHGNSGGQMHKGLHVEMNRWSATYMVRQAFYSDVFDQFNNGLTVF